MQPAGENLPSIRANRLVHASDRSRSRGARSLAGSVSAESSLPLSRRG